MKPTSSKGRSPWKVKKARGTVAGGIVIPTGAIVVNQGLCKVKLEEDFVDQKPELPVSMEVEQDSNSWATSTEAVSGGGEAFTEEYQVTKVEVDIPNIQMMSEETPGPSEDDGHDDYSGSSTDTEEEIESLKTTVRKLRLQIDKQNEVIKKQDKVIKKQNEVIGGMKSFMRNIGLSMATYFNDGEEEENNGGRCHDNNEESPANNSGSTFNDSLIDNESGSRSGGIDNDDNMNVDGEGVVGGNKQSSNLRDRYPPETSSIEAGFSAEVTSEAQKDSDLEDGVNRKGNKSLAKFSAKKATKKESAPETQLSTLGEDLDAQNVARSLNQKIY